MIETARDILGIDIGMSSIKFAWVSKNGLSADIKATAVKTMPRAESGGFVDNNKAFVADLIKSTVKEIGLPSKKVFLCLSGPNIFTRRVMVVSMPHDELKEAVKWTVKDQIPLDIDRVVVDYKVLGETKDAKGTTYLNILAAAVDKNFIFDCVDVMKQSGLYLAGIGLFPFAAHRLQGKNEIMAVIDIGAFKSEFTLLSSGLPQFSRSLPGSGNEFTKALTGVLVSDKGRLELSYDQAEKMKIETGIPQAETQIMSMLRPVVERLENELKRSMEYCRDQLKLPVPKKIFLTGGGALLKNLNSTLTRDLGLEFAYLKDEKSVFFDTAVAAAMDEGMGLDLMPLEVKEERARRLQHIYLRMVIVVSFSVLLVSYIFMSLKIQNLQRQINIANANYNAIQEILVLKDKIDDRMSVLSKVGSGRYPSSIVLKALSKAVPSSVELDTVTRNNNGDIIIKGTVASGRPEAILADFTENMQDTEVFERIKILSLQKKQSKTSTSDFNMHCEVAPKIK